MRSVVSQYAVIEDVHRRQERHSPLSHQRLTWKSRPSAAVGVSASNGVTIGGAAATVAGVTFAAAQGIVQGASGA